jgi:hypothetical protein
MLQGFLMRWSAQSSRQKFLQSTTVLGDPNSKLTHGMLDQDLALEADGTATQKLERAIAEWNCRNQVPFRMEQIERHAAPRKHSQEVKKFMIIS